MKYTFQDSTDLPVQRDFIKDLQDFIKLSRETIPVENAARLLNEKKKKNTVSAETKIKGIDEFEIGVTTAIQGLAINIESLGLTDVKDEISVATASISSKKKTELYRQLEDNLKAADYEIEQLSSKMLSILSPFFEEGVYNSISTYSFLQEEERINGKQISSTENMEYWFELKFNNDKLKVKDLYEKFSLPVWVSGGLLHREDKVKKIDMSDHHIISMEYDGDEHLEAVLKDDNSEHVFKIVADENTFIILHNDQDITIDEKLAESLEEDEVLLLIKKMKLYFSVAVQSRTLIRVFIDGKDAIDNNRVFDCLKIIAATYGALIKDCLAKGYNKDEISIKIERPDETRTEKYISRAEVFKQLSEIGSEGFELASIMKVSDN
ncbi:hypothetical protein Mpsy_0767 [Methanolobus psychrophilus R15]|nr:hypothetical protein Mpsy_0767 [Methanolobus psychrophilus R15]